MRCGVHEPACIVKNVDSLHEFHCQTSKFLWDDHPGFHSPSFIERRALHRPTGVLGRLYGSPRWFISQEQACFAATLSDQWNVPKEARGLGLKEGKVPPPSPCLEHTTLIFYCTAFTEHVLLHCHRTAASVLPTATDRTYRSLISCRRYLVARRSRQASHLPSGPSIFASQLDEMPLSSLELGHRQSELRSSVHSSSAAVVQTTALTSARWQ